MKTPIVDFILQDSPDSVSGTISNFQNQFDEFISELKALKAAADELDRLKPKPPPLLLGDCVYLNAEGLDPLVVIDRLPHQTKFADASGKAMVFEDELYYARAQTVWRDGIKIWKRTNIQASENVNNKGLVEHDATPKTTHKGSFASLDSN